MRSDFLGGWRRNCWTIQRQPPHSTSGLNIHPVQDTKLGNLSTRRSWFTNGMAGRPELDKGRSLRPKCKSWSKPTWNHHERRQNNSIENVFQRFAWSFVSFLRRKHDFRRRISTCMTNTLQRTQNFWASGFNLRTRVLKSVMAFQERLDIYTPFLTAAPNRLGQIRECPMGEQT